MKIDLTSVFNAEGVSVSYDTKIKLNGSDEETDPNFISGITCKGAVRNHAGMVEMDAVADFDYSAACDRCAETAVRHFSLPLRHRLIQQLSGDYNDEYIEVGSTSLDLDELVWEDVILSLPMQWLCKPECKGLCPMCGADLNKGACGCKKPADPRFDILESLLES